MIISALQSHTPSKSYEFQSFLKQSPTLTFDALTDVLVLCSSNLLQRPLARLPEFRRSHASIAEAQEMLGAVAARQAVSAPAAGSPSVRGNQEQHVDAEGAGAFCFLPIRYVLQSVTFTVAVASAPVNCQISCRLREVRSPLWAAGLSCD